MGIGDLLLSLQKIIFIMSLSNYAEANNLKWI